MGEGIPRRGPLPTFSRDPKGERYSRYSECSLGPTVTISLNARSETLSFALRLNVN
jgi:hypothetical protein